MRTPLSLAVNLSALLFSPLVAQSSDPSRLTLQRIYQSGEFRGEPLSEIRWLRGDSAYTVLEPETGTTHRAIIRYGTNVGPPRPLVSSRDLTPAGRAEPLDVEAYDFSEDQRLVLIFTNSQRVWRQNTRGDYWVLDRAAKTLRQLGGGGAASSLMFAKFSPDGRYVAFVRANNVYVEELAGGTIRQLTNDGSPTTINGTFDWVYEEELDLRDGFRWSPDSRHIAYWQLDTRGVRDFFLINNTDSLYSRVIAIPYPKAGTTNSAGRVGVVSVDGGETRWLNVPGDPREHYIARMEWAASPSEIVLQQLNRHQQVNTVYLADAQAGTVRAVLVERDSAWVDLAEDLEWLDGGKRFLWQSERDGWRHLYLVSRDGRTSLLLTPGAFDVASVAGIDRRRGWVYFIASPSNATQRYLYRVHLVRRSLPERLTPVEEVGVHRYDVSPDGRWAIHSRSTFGTPTTVNLLRLSDHHVERILIANAPLRETVNALHRGPMKFFRVDIGKGVSVDGYIMRPADYDSTKRYPVLFYVYGEPAGTEVVDEWTGRGYLWHLMLTQLGYTVVCIDNRGTPMLHGRAWRKAIYRKIGVVASEEQAAAARIIGTWPGIDSTRFGVWGWSGGGSMTLNLMFRSPDLYRVGMAVAPVPDIHFYDTIYQERYMGLPQENSEDYRQASPITFAGQLKGELLVVHGTGDDNVHYQGTEALVNALVAANKQFRLMSYPNRSHGIFEGENTTMHLFEMLTRYLQDHLPTGGR